MHKITVAFLFLLALTSCTSLVANKQYEYPDKSPYLNHLGRSTVALVALSGEHHDKWRLFCSGVWIAPNIILTCSHCVEAMAEVQEQADPYHVDINYIVESEVVGVGVNPIRVHKGVVIKADFDHDMALIATKGETPLHDIATVAENRSAIGSEVNVVGHPRGLYWRYTRGEITAYRNALPGDDRDLNYVEIAAPIDHGSSGCGVYNEKGELVGILESMHSESVLVGWAIDLPRIRRFLADKDR